MKSPNPADLADSAGQPLTPTWFDLHNYDLEDDWTCNGGKLRVYRPAEDEEDQPLDFN